MLNAGLMAWGDVAGEVARNPFSGDASTVRRTKDASLSVGVTSRTVVVAMSGKRSDWITKGARGLP